MATIVDLKKMEAEITAEREAFNKLVEEFIRKHEAPILEKEAAYRYLVKLGDNPFIQAPAENIWSRPLNAEIKDAIPKLCGKEFINADIEAILGKEGIRPRITNELNKLVEQGMLECTHKGVGRTPSRFKEIQV